MTMPQTPNVEVQDPDFLSLATLVGIIVRNWLPILVITLIGIACGVALAKFSPNQYTVRTMLEPDRSSPEFSWILKSEPIALEVATKLNLAKHWGFDSPVAVIPQMMKKVQIRDGRAVEIIVTDTSPALAAEILNMYVKVGARVAVEMRLVPQAKQFHFLKIRVEDAVRNKVAAERELSSEDAKKVLSEIPQQYLDRLLYAMKVQASILNQTLLLPYDLDERNDQKWTMSRLQEQLLFMQRQMLDPANSPGLTAQGYTVLTNVLAREYWTAIERATQDRILDIENEYNKVGSFAMVQPPVEPSGPSRGRIVFISTVLSLIVSVLLTVAIAVVRRLRLGTLYSPFVEVVKRQ